MKSNTRKYMNPYLAGILLGLVLLAAFYVSGRGLGASGAVKSGVVCAMNTIAPEHTADTEYFAKYVKSHPESSMKSWLVFLAIGVFVGGFTSGARSGRLKFKIDKGPGISSKTRLIMAVAGGVLFGLGSQLGRGCTSGSALSGMAVMSEGGLITMAAIFGGGYIFAYFFRKLWI